MTRTTVTRGEHPLENWNHIQSRNPEFYRPAALTCFDTKIFAYILYNLVARYWMTSVQEKKFCQQYMKRGLKICLECLYILVVNLLFAKQQVD